MADKQDERRREILAVALQAFGETGYDKTSMDDVVRATGLSKGTIYWYFKNKEELFAALMEYVIDQFFDEFELVLSQAHEVSPQAAINMIFATVGAILDSDPNFGSLTVDFMLQALHYPSIRQKYANYYTRYINDLSEIIQHGIDAGEFRTIDVRATAATLIGLLDGLMLQALIGEEIDLDWRWQAKNILQVAETLFLNGLIKEVMPDDK